MKNNKIHYIGDHVCIVCGKHYEYDYRSYNSIKYYEKNPSRFCSRKCANSYSSLKSKGLYKSIKCNLCNEIFSVNSHTPNTTFICDKCKEKLKIDKKHKIKHNSVCSFCGRSISLTNIKRHENSCEKNPNAVHYKTGKLRKDIREGYIYKITNNINGKFYIGKHRGKPEDSKSYFGSGIAIVNAIKKYGKENFSKEVLHYTENGNLNELEMYYIKEYNAYESEMGYNMTKGGDGGNFIGHHHSEETKNKLRKNKKELV